MPPRSRPPRAAPLAIAAVTALAACGPRQTATMTDLCAGAPLDVAPYGPQVVVADLLPHDEELRGISGLVASRAHEGTLWAISDTATQLFAIELRDDGVEVRSTRVRGVDRFDWEDLAWFEEDGDTFLMIADVGTNRPASTARTRDGRQVGELHVVAEPRPGDKKVKVQRTITFTLPCEPIRDLEAVAVDSARREILLVEKRAAVKRLLVLDLDQGHHEPTPDDWTEVTLPDLHPHERQPASSPSARLYQTSWRRNPTALDVLDRRAVLLTNRHAYVYEREPGASWPRAFASAPLQLQLPFTLELPGRAPQTLPSGAAPVLPQREAVCFDRDGAAVFVASEQRGAAEAWLVRFDRR